MPFRFRSKFLLLTYKSHINIEKLKETLKRSKREFKMKVAHETGDDHHPYLHTHILVKFLGKKRIYWTSERKFDIDEVHPHWKAVKTREHFERVYNYLDKENCILNELKLEDYPINNGFSNDLIEKIQEHKSFQAVVCDPSISYEIAGKMKWARTVFDARPKPNLTENLKLNKFQNKVLDLIAQQNDRQILWVYDQKGGAGKSVLTNWLIDNRNAFFCNGGKLSDIAHAYEDQELVIFDLPRCVEEFSPYKAMECFKDGRLFSPKYESKMKRFKPCQVVVFANFEPDEHKMSADRWIIWDLSNTCGPCYHTTRGSLNINRDPGYKNISRDQKSLSSESDYG